MHEINPTNALVDGGTRWLDLLARAIPQGLTPATLVDFLELTVGGTLSLGGIGSQAFLSEARKTTGQWGFLYTLKRPNFGSSNPTGPAILQVAANRSMSVGTLIYSATLT